MKKIESFFDKFFRIALFFIGVAIIAWLAKPNLVGIYNVSGFSMYPTLTSGQYILVSKFRYRLQTPNNLFFTSLYLPSFTYDIDNVGRGDVIIFKSPIYWYGKKSKQREKYNIKRITGIPGDYITFKNSNFTLVENSIRRESGLDSLFEIPEKKGEIELKISTRKFWEPIIVLDGHEIETDSSGNVYINNQQQKKYTVMQNFYFLEGDLPNVSSDSRRWGLIPHKDLIGKVEFVIWPTPFQRIVN